MAVFQQRLAAAFVAALASTASVAAETPKKGEGETAQNERRLLSNRRQLIFEGHRSGEGYFSADGSQMIFQSEREPGNPFYQIYLMNLETGDTERVSPGVGKTTCAWIHPNGDKVLFASTHEDPQARAKQQEELDKRAAGKASRYAWSFDEHYDIFEADTKGKDLKNLTHGRGYDAEGSWSPDGTLIAFASNRHAYGQALSPEEQKTFTHDKSYFMEIYLMHAEGTQVRRLTNAAGYDGGPFFSPDGRKIIWRRFSTDGATAEVWTMNVDGSQMKQITHLGVMSWAPYYHPSGDYIIFTNNAHGFGNFELYIVDSKGKSEPIRVTHTKGFDGLPVFTPDGEHLAWSSARTADHKAQLFLADWNDAEARKLLGLGDQPEAKRESAGPSHPQVPDLKQTTADISPEDLRLHVGYLASEALDGRLTGSEGERLATDYVASVFRALGLQPAGDNGTFFQSFEFTAGVSLDRGNKLTSQFGKDRHHFTVDQDWRPLAFSRLGTHAPSTVVFAGYGIVAPATDQFPAYDAYAGQDVKDQWALVFRYLPEDITPEYRQHLSNYASLRYKAMLARDQGARGLILVSGPNAHVKDPLIKLSFDTVLAGTSIGAISVTDETADLLLQSAGKKVQALQDALDSGEPVEGFPLPGIKLAASIHMRQERRSGRNILARLTADDQPGESAVIIGAHVDHIGHGASESLAREDEKGKVHHGADDNASGVAALLEIAQYLADQKAKGKLKIKRDLLFAAWSGEELGLLGSGHFVRTFANQDHASASLAPQITAYLNMDMIGRLDKQLYLQGVGSSSLWASEIERRNVPVGLPIVTHNDSYLPTDATSFYLKGVPVLSAFTGVHPEYNTPRDTAGRINYAGAAQVGRLMGLMTRSLAMRDDPPDYIAMEKPVGSPSRRNLRAYLGTIPEYGNTDIKGVKLNGVAKGGPAAEAGLQGGDIIVEVAGRKIENIYDYTYALNALKVSQPVEIVVQRAGEHVTFTTTPGSRE